MTRILFIVVGLMTISYSDLASGALQCYECLTCTDPFNASQAIKKTCPTAIEQVCYKFKASAGGVDVVTRGCIPKTSSDVFCDSAKKSSSVVDYCGTCSTDLCNSSSAIASSLVILMTTMFVKLVV
ncbi:unnamed protein product [Acanthoscelides obtectus]|uniref:Protein sleepless n=1 Tax=Acanthoscelides obtectus TaxID=200917 RepID=A0A9P0P6C9_ACAOB|nr:unnamed protein product [Acanthoscelides obtectus]CAK1635557.1 hypothetical protein AOBTE_LOCUS9352 [Acanthoscelides obtectus]